MPSIQLYWPNQAPNVSKHSRNHKIITPNATDKTKYSNKSSLSISSKQHSIFNKLTPIMESLSHAQKTMPNNGLIQETLKLSPLKKRSTSYSGSLLDLHANNQIKDILNQKTKLKVSKVKSSPKEIIYVVSKK